MSHVVVRRDLAAASLVAAALLALVSVALQPDLPPDHAARLVALDRAGAGGAVSAVAFLLQQLPFLVGLLGLGHLLRERAPRLATGAVVLGAVGAFGHTVFGGMSLVYLTMAHDVVGRSSYARVWAEVESGPAMLFAVAGLAGTVLALVLLVAALARTELAPRWVPGLLIAFLVLEFAGGAISSMAPAAGSLCLLAAFGALAARVHGSPAALWGPPVLLPRQVAIGSDR